MTNVQTPLSVSPAQNKPALGIYQGIAVGISILVHQLKDYRCLHPGITQVKVYAVLKTYLRTTS